MYYVCPVDQPSSALDTAGRPTCLDDGLAGQTLEISSTAATTSGCSVMGAATRRGHPQRIIRPIPALVLVILVLRGEYGDTMG